MRLTRICSAVGVVLAAVLGMAAPSAVATTSGSGTYSLNISPSTALAGGVSTTFNVAITDEASSAIRLGALDLTAPSGFQLVSASLPPSSPGSATINGNVVQFRTLRLTPGSTVNATVVATTPCTDPATTWTSTAHNEFNDTGAQLTFDPSQSSVGATISSPCSVQWTTEPTDTVIGQTITGTALTPSGPALVAQLEDGNGNPIAAAGVPVTVSIDNNPSGGTLSGTLTEDTSSSGAASFDDLSIDQPGNGYTLDAASPGYVTGTSTGFNEVNSGTTCPTGQTCTTTATTNDSSLSATGSGNVTVSVDVGTALTCTGYTAQDGNWFSFTSSSSAGKLVSYTIMPSTVKKEAVGMTQFCFGATYEFNTNAGTPAPAATLPDGTSGFVGLLPLCSGTPTQPCISARSKTADPKSPVGYDITFQVTIPAGLPGDPWGRM